LRSMSAQCLRTLLPDEPETTFKAKMSEHW
jgi:hypothetical protein